LRDKKLVPVKKLYSLADTPREVPVGRESVSPSLLNLRKAEICIKIVLMLVVPILGSAIAIILSAAGYF
jgi:hypothetical protein